MSKPILEELYWNCFSAAEVETLLSQVGICLGLTPTRKDFLNQVHDYIHGGIEPEDMYHESIRNLYRASPEVLLDFIEKHLTKDQKKQLKIWYTELLCLEPMDETNILTKMMIPYISNVINTF